MSDDALGLFLREIARTPLLTAAEERELARRVERGDLAAKDRMIRANLRLVVHIAKRFQREDSGMTLQDLIQEGTIGLVRAVEKFDHRRGYRFSTYATLWIRQAVGRGLSDKGRIVRLPVPVADRVRRLERAERELTAGLGGTPGPDELAGALGWEAGEVEQLRGAARRPASLEAPVGADGDAGLADLLPAAGPTPEDVALAGVERARLAAALAGLAPRERRVIELRYGLRGESEHSAAETARALGIRPQQVRRSEERALRELGDRPELRDAA